MPSITVGHEAEATWMVARWAFCGYLEHVKEEIRGESDLEFTIERAMALDGLHLTLLEDSVTWRLVPVLLHVADEIVGGRRQARVEGRALDERSQEQFRQAVQELRGLLDRHLLKPAPIEEDSSGHE